MYILKGFTPTEIESIKEGNRVLLKLKLETEVKKWEAILHCSREDHRFNQGVCCTLLDMLELM